MKKYLVPVILGAVFGLILVAGLFFYEFGMVDESFTFTKIKK